jgi:molybdopterin/thiamine biosynthesis adenylyltransferase|tara:strand:+ start:861 stop:1559 length:699 start_codon:yes stop_codon:yes gene_type:complete
MKQKLNATIIGAGGVTSYLLPALKRSFDLNVVLFDADKLEKHNLDRQLFRNSDIGKYKAEALLKANMFRKSEAIAVCSYFEEDLLDTEYRLFFGSNCDVIICAADNHPARRAAIHAANEMKKPLIIAANEFSTSQAFFYDPQYNMEYQKIDPYARYPEIETSNEGSPIRCQGEALESTPQLAIANQVAASFANYLIWSWFCEGYGNTSDTFNPVEFQSTFSRMETITLADCK